MKECKKCNKTYSDNQNFCQTCGDALIIVSDTASNISQENGNKCCTKCNITYDSDKKFCKKCGSQLIIISAEILKIDAKIMVYEEQLKSDQLNINLLSEYAQFLYDSEKYKSANSLLLRIEAIDEKNQFAKYLMFKSFLKLKQYSDSLSVGENLLLIDEKNISLIFQLADTSSALNMQEKEMSFYDKVLDIEPNNIIAIEKKASLLLKKNLIADALPLFDKLHSLSQTQRLTIIYAGISKIINKDYQSGINLLNNKVLNEDDYHNYRGYLYLAYGLCQTNGELEDIERYFNKVRFHILASYPFTLDEELAAIIALYIVGQKIQYIQGIESPTIAIDKIIKQYLNSEDAFFKETSKPILAEAWFIIGSKQKELNLFLDAEYSFDKAFELNPDEEKYTEKLDEILFFVNKIKNKQKIKKGIQISIVLITLISIIAAVNISNKKTENKVWEFAKVENTTDSYKHYLNLYPDDRYTRFAQDKIDSIMWSNALKSNSYESFKYYCDSSYHKANIVKADSLEQLVLWNSALKKNTYETYQRYIDIFPKGIYSDKANNILEKKLWSKAIKDNIESTYKEYLNRFPDGKYIKEANTYLDENSWQNAISKNSKSGFEEYKQNYPNGKHFSEANSMIENFKNLEAENQSKSVNYNNSTAVDPGWYREGYQCGVVAQDNGGYSGTSSDSWVLAGHSGPMNSSWAKGYEAGWRDEAYRINGR